MTGKELYARYGEDVLGPWEGQPADVQRAWEEIAAGVTAELAEGLDKLLGAPPYTEETWRAVVERKDRS